MYAKVQTIKHHTSIPTIVVNMHGFQDLRKTKTKIVTDVRFEAVPETVRTENFRPISEKERDANRVRSLSRTHGQKLGMCCSQHPLDNRLVEDSLNFGLKCSKIRRSIHSSGWNQNDETVT